MPCQVAERTFDRVWDVGVGERRAFVDRNGEEVEWLHSYVSEDNKEAFCGELSPSAASSADGSDKRGREERR
jgi:hypothetical protein